MENKAIKISITPYMRYVFEQQNQINIITHAPGSYAEDFGTHITTNFLQKQGYNIDNIRIKLKVSEQVPKPSGIYYVSTSTLKLSNITHLVFTHVLLNPEDKCSAIWILGYLPKEEIPLRGVLCDEKWEIALSQILPMREWSV